MGELPLERARETTMLTAEEFRADLEEVGAPVEALDAHEYATDLVGDDPQAGFEAGLQDHPETLDFPPVEVAQTTRVEAEL